MGYMKILVIALVLLVSFTVQGNDNGYDTLAIKPIGLSYSKYNGTDKLYVVGEVAGMTGNQVVVFQNRPSFEYFEKNDEYLLEQKQLEDAIWEEILDGDDEAIIVTGRWHKYNDRMVFLSHQILQINKNPRTTVLENTIETEWSR